MNIIFEDEQIIVVQKETGMISEDGTSNSVVKQIQKHLNKQDCYVGVVHRLDKVVGGIMVYAKTREAAKDLSQQMADKSFKKTYYAVVTGHLAQRDRLEDFLYHDRLKNKTYVTKSHRNGVKQAILEYNKIKSVDINDKRLNLLEINLITGRTHQIRAQFASRKHPLVGDRRYGGDENSFVALFCGKISFVSPLSKQPVSFSLPIPEFSPFNCF